jgi:hypothetical protein
MLAAAALSALVWAGRHPAPLRAHPLHTSLAEISYEPDGHLLVIRVRLFADDLSAAIFAGSDAFVPASKEMPPDSLLWRYARGTIALADPEGRPIQLCWRGAARAGDTVLLELQAKMATDGPRRVRILQAMLWERFPDQVNIVRASYEGRTVTLLFTRGDPGKLLP